MSYAYTPMDIYWGQLSGCLEAIHAGTTTVLDHAHLVCSTEHGKSNPMSDFGSSTEIPLQPTPR